MWQPLLAGKYGWLDLTIPLSHTESEWNERRHVLNLSMQTRMKYTLDTDFTLSSLTNNCVLYLIPLPAYPMIHKPIFSFLFVVAVVVVLFDVCALSLPIGKVVSAARYVWTVIDRLSESHSIASVLFSFSNRKFVKLISFPVVSFDSQSSRH